MNRLSNSALARAAAGLASACALALVFGLAGTASSAAGSSTTTSHIIGKTGGPGTGTPAPTVHCQAAATWWNGSQSAWYDGANCFLRMEPAGTSLFVYANKYYMMATASHTCPKGNFDGAHCYIRPKPPGGFVWNNAFYGLAGAGNSCPTGSAYDGAHCYYGAAAWGTTAFEYNGNFYTTTLPSCVDGAYDGAHCYIGKPPPATTAFINNGQYFYYKE